MMVDPITNSPGHGGPDCPGWLVTMVDLNMVRAQSRLPNMVCVHGSYITVDKYASPFLTDSLS